MSIDLYTEDKIQVSILCQSYNHENFIEQALESFVTQITNFKFEVLIHDDASADQTINIINKYQRRYPDIIKPTFQIENQYSKGVRGFVVKYLIPKSKGKYLIVCDGDDYFCDVNKLQLQVDFLEGNPEYAICFHPVRVFFENNLKNEYIHPDRVHSKYFSLKNLLLRNFIQTNSAMYRRQNYGELTIANMLPNDWYLHIFHANNGKIGFINKIMSAYRKHPNGIWWDKADNLDKFYMRNGISHLIMQFEIYKLVKFNAEYKIIIFTQINTLLSRLMRLLNLDEESLLNTHLKEYSLEILELKSWKNLSLSFSTHGFLFSL